MKSVAYLPHPLNPIRNWRDLVEVESSFSHSGGWAFRGQDSLNFPSTSLERLCESLGLGGDDRIDLEVKLVREFGRSYHVYSGAAPPPRKGYTLEWLSLLRHYGTPTRLLDFTYSFFTATFFALEDHASCAVIWAFNVAGLAQEADALISAKLSGGSKLLAAYNKKRDGRSFRALFMEQSPPARFVYSANPMRLNERLTVQQGLFLAPGDITTTFEDNLCVIPNHASHVKQIIIDPVCRHEILMKLHRIGINSATLYPGLEGFAKSLRTKALILKDLPPQGVDTLKEI